MEKYEEIRDKAIKNIKIADHMLTQTYPLVKDPRLLLTVLENVFLSLTNAIGALLYFERLYKRIPSFNDTFESKYNTFKMKLVYRYNIDKENVKFIADVKSIIVSHKKSPVEFSRKGVFVMCSEDYRMRALTPEEMRKYVARAKAFVGDINSIIKQNEMDMKI